MSWGSKLTEWASGRFSPFDRPGAHDDDHDHIVTDDDFSYITADDLKNHEEQQRLQQQQQTSREDSDAQSYDGVGSDHKFRDHHSHHHHHSPSGRDSSTHHDSPQRRHSPSSHHHSSHHSDRASRNTDSVVFKNKSTKHTVHFAAYAIDDGEVTIRHLREKVAAKLQIGNPSRIRLIYRGQNLKTDESLACDVGMRSSEIPPEVLCVVGDEPEDDESGSGTSDNGEELPSPSGQKPRNRKKKKSKRKKGGAGSNSSSSTQSSPVATPSADRERAEFLPVPQGTHPLHQTQSAQSNSRQGSSGPAQPTSKVGQLQALEDTFKAEYEPLCKNYIDNPPADKEARIKEHTKISETVLRQIILKIDDIQADGDPEVRATRKEKIKYVQGWLDKIDAIKGS